MDRIKNSVPNFFTLGNLACGILSLLMTFQGNYKVACVFILLAALMDRYDGKVARFLNVSSELGKELDSLADLVSFGVAPSLLAFNSCGFTELGALGYFFAVIFPIAGAYRLARYNITSFNGNFAGVPIPVAGGFLALYSLITLNYTTSLNITMILVIVLSFLMVSNLKFKKV